MTSDYLTLGPVPFEEECQGVGMPTYDLSAALAECKRYRRLLEELFPPPEGVYGLFKTKAFPHDFGAYHEVCAIFDADDEASCAWACDVENSLPATWDDRPVLKPRPTETDGRLDCHRADAEAHLV